MRARIIGDREPAGGFHRFIRARAARENTQPLQAGGRQAVEELHAVFGEDALLQTNPRVDHVHATTT